MTLKEILKDTEFFSDDKKLTLKNPGAYKNLLENEAQIDENGSLWLSIFGSNPKKTQWKKSN